VIENDAVAAFAPRQVGALAKLEELIFDAVAKSFDRAVRSGDDWNAGFSPLRRQDPKIDSAVLIVGRRPASVIAEAWAGIYIDVILNKAGLVGFTDKRQRQNRAVVG
jgi:hypothetical protein